MNKMLEPNPAKRINSEQCLNHPFFQSIRVKKDEFTFGSEFMCDFELDESITLDQLKKLILEEINLFKIENNEPLLDIDNEINRLKKVSLRLEEERIKN